MSTKHEYFVGPDPVSDIRDRAWEDYTLDLSPAQGERLVYLCELANKAGREGKEFPQEARQEIATYQMRGLPYVHAAYQELISEAHWDGLAEHEFAARED